MKRFTPVSSLACALAGTLALAACSDEASAPLAPTMAGTSLSVEAGSSSSLVLFKGNGVPAGFAERVQGLGGTVTYAHAGVGFAMVEGLSDAGAAEIRAMSSVAGVTADTEFTLHQPQDAASMEFDGSAADEIQSQANPATASRYVWQWNMRSIGANKAWAAGKLGSSNVTVAILDTGIDYDAPDLNGLVDLSRSRSFVPGDNTITSTYFPSRNQISDYNGHGTNVATQVSSKAIALAGVTSRTTLIGVKVLGAKGSGSLGGIISGITWAADQGAHVANMSLGGVFAKPGNGQAVALIQRTMNYAKQKGMLVVVAAGNERADLDHDGNLFKTYCGTVHVICVSAVGPESAGAYVDQPSAFTNFGRSSINVAAPGGNYRADFAASPWPWGNDIASWVWSYCSKTKLVLSATGGVLGYAGCQAGNRLTGQVGTSQAAPHVAGLAALLMAEHGTGNPVRIKQIIEASSADLGQSGTDPYYGRGRIDVGAALGL
ncbi:S8 family serine peptidase [Longimicrobium sp.]|jgi:subtilisin family serine protease|uniref:S8 family serine peptidase n=1 Tax=Longimicrobium sp. TaxID=2029185 RepID=UPI002EDAE3FB